MRTWFTAVVVGFLAAGCATKASTPSQGERQALAPTGKLRVALYTGAPASIVRGLSLRMELSLRVTVTPTPSRPTWGSSR